MTLARWQRIDVLVNDAGLMTFEAHFAAKTRRLGPGTDREPRALFRLCQLCLPHMQGGAIVAVSSVHAHQTTPNVVSYAASKGAMEAFVRGLSLEISHEQARINAVAAGGGGHAHALGQPQREKRGRENHGPSGHTRQPGGRHLLPSLARGRLYQRHHPGSGWRQAGAALGRPPEKVSIAQLAGKAQQQIILRPGFRAILFDPQAFFKPLS
ncbi:MAG: SDR family NAD(P)-dependent oxidoreductase [Hymenobacter sp.]